MRKAKVNVCILVQRLLEAAVNTDNSVFVIKGRGELQLAVLLKTMRREGYEFGVAVPIYEESGQREPFGPVQVDVDTKHKVKSGLNSAEKAGKAADMIVLCALIALLLYFVRAIFPEIYHWVRTLLAHTWGQ